jgi:hypothetical protein
MSNSDNTSLPSQIQRHPIGYEYNHLESVRIARILDIDILTIKIDVKEIGTILII